MMDDQYGAPVRVKWRISCSPNYAFRINEERHSGVYEAHEPFASLVRLPRFAFRITKDRILYPEKFLSDMRLATVCKKHAHCELLLLDELLLLLDRIGADANHLYLGVLERILFCSDKNNVNILSGGPRCIPPIRTYQQGHRGTGTPP